MELKDLFELFQDVTWQQVTILGSSIAIVAWVSPVIYRLTLHPLAGFPGPKLYAVSRIPLSLSYLRGDAHQATNDLHEKYGPIVRTRPNEIRVADAEVWKEVYGTGSRRDPFPRMKKSTNPQNKIFGGTSMFDADVPNHARQRKQMLKAFSDSALRQQEGLITNYIDLFMERLKEQAGKPLDMTAWFNFTTFDIIGRLTFGEDFHCLQNGQYHPWVGFMFSSMKLLVYAFVIFDIAPWLASLTTFIAPKSAAEGGKQAAKYTMDMADRRMAQGEGERKDFMSFILAKDKDGHSALTKGEIYQNSQLMIIAGSETSATTLAAATFLLLSNPDKMARLVKEIRETFQEESEINFQSTAALEYLRAVVNEALRVHHPVAIFPNRFITEPGCTIGGRYVAPGSTVMFSGWSAFRSELNFKNGANFIPERWTKEGSEEYKDDRKDVFQPFGYGPADCLGRNLAWMEIRTILARMIWAFDLELLPESKNWTEQKSYLIWEKPSLMVKMVERKHK